LTASCARSGSEDKRRHEAVVSLAEIERRILTLCGQKVMLDSDLAELYGVTTKKLAELERRITDHDDAIRSLVTAIRQLMNFPSIAPRRQIGVRVEEARPTYGRHRRQQRRVART
jgi:hypothetical protein